MIEIDIDARDVSVWGGLASTFFFGGFSGWWSVSGGLCGRAYYRLWFLGGKRRGHTTGSGLVLVYTVSYGVGVRFCVGRVKPRAFLMVVSGLFSGLFSGWPAYWLVHTGVYNFYVILYAPMRGGLRKH